MNRRVFLHSTCAAAGSLALKSRTARAADRTPATRPARPRRPELASPWFRIVEYPSHHLNDFCLFHDYDGIWHAIGIMGTGTWKSETRLFHATGPDLSTRFDTHPPVLTQNPGPGVPPQKHAPFVVCHNARYHLFYRRPMGTILRIDSEDPDHWPGLGDEVFTARDARDVCIQRFDALFHMYYCQCAAYHDELRSCILLRRSADLNRWSDPVIVHADTAQPCEHSYLESPCVVRRPEGYYLFMRHRLLDEQSSTVVLFSPRPDRFPSGQHRWFHRLDHVHAPEIVTLAGRNFIARVSGAPHACHQAPRTGGWIDIAALRFSPQP